MNKSPETDNSKNLTRDEIAIFIKAYLDIQIEKELQKAGSEKLFGKFKNIWNSSKKSRLAIGLSLSAGVLATTLSGSFAVAGGLLMARAVLGSIGGYMATDSIYEIINSKFSKNPFEKILRDCANYKSKEELENAIEELLSNTINNSREDLEKEFTIAQEKIKGKKRIKAIMSATSALVLGVIGGSRAAEAVSIAAAPADAIKSGVNSKVMGILGNSTSVKKVDTSLIKEIFKDIKADHPNQGYVTLEQAERRIAGLRMGIPLNESDRLTDLNIPISKGVREPGSGIRKAMESLGIIGKGESIDSVASRLDENSIEKILIKAHENDLSVAADIAEPIMKKTAISDKIASFGLGFLSAAGLGILGKLAYGRNRNQTFNEETQYSPIRINPESIEDAVILPAPEIRQIGMSPTEEKPKIRKRETYEESPKETMKSDKTEKSRNKEIRENRINTMASVIMDGYGFKFEKADGIDDGQIMAFSKNTVGGAFVLLVREFRTQISIDMLWYDGGENRSKIKGKIITNSISEDYKVLRENLNSEILRTYKETLIERDRIKCIELAENLQTIEISKNDLHLIYKQSDHPEILSKNAETGGFWFQNIYDFNGGNLKMQNLQNPKTEEMNIQELSFSLKPEMENILKWDVFKYLDSVNYQFDAIEASIINDMRTKGNDNLKSSLLPGSAFAYNWHKHPGNLYHPSLMDLNSPSSSCTIDFKNNPHQMTYLWGIVNHLGRGTDESNNPRNSIILRGKDHSGKNDYIIHFWRVNRKKSSAYSYEDLMMINAKISS